MAFTSLQNMLDTSTPSIYFVKGNSTIFDWNAAWPRAFWSYEPVYCAVFCNYFLAGWKMFVVKSRLDLSQLVPGSACMP